MGTEYTRSRGSVSYSGGPSPEAIRRADATPDPPPPGPVSARPPMTPSPVTRPAGGDRRGGTADLAGAAAPVAPPNGAHRFGLDRLPEPTGRRPA